jgi:predicted ester cyclase
MVRNVMKSNSIPKLFLTMVATFAIAMIQQDVTGENALLASSGNITTDSKAGNIISLFAIETKEKEEEEKNIQTIMHLKDAINTGDTSRIHEFISPQYYNHESWIDPLRSKLRGPAEFIDTVSNLLGAFDNLHHEVQETIAAGNKVVQIITVTGKHTGNFFVIPPTGNNISHQAVHVYRIGEDGI